MSQAKVVIIKGKGIQAAAGKIAQDKIVAMIQRGLQHLSESPNLRDGIARFFPYNDRIGIKINTLGGPQISTRPEVSLSFANVLVQGGLKEKNIVIWDRTNRELRDAGYTLSDSANSIKILATDTAGAGYETEPISHLNIGSLFSTIQTNFVTASISLAILKDHGLAGITASLKNYFGAIHNPNKYHDTHCDPYVAELFQTRPIQEKHKLSVLDALLVQYHRGPSFHRQWAEPCGALIFSRDAVAADAVGWRLIEKLRSQKGLPTLKEEGREPTYLITAEKMLLGACAPEKIQIIEDEV